MLEGEHCHLSLLGIGGWWDSPNMRPGCGVGSVEDLPNIRPAVVRNDHAVCDVAYKYQFLSS